MTSNTPGGQLELFRHRITNIRLEPSTSSYDIQLKILVDGQEAHRLPPIRRGGLLLWDRVIPCDVNLNSRVEIRAYEKHFFTVKRVGTLGYTVSAVAGQSDARFEFDTKQFTAAISFATAEVDKQAPANALAEAKAKEKNTRLLERLGPTRDALKKILEFGAAVSELHPAAKVAFGICTVAWQTLEKQEQCDASVEQLVVGLAEMLPFVQHVEKAVRLPQLQSSVANMMNIIEDASRFVIEYKSDRGPVQNLRAVIGSTAQDQVQALLGKFQNLKEAFDRGVSIQTLGTVDEVHEAVLTNAQRGLLNELKPVGSARCDAARACLPGTRTDIIKEIVAWSQERGASKDILWVHGQAGLGKSSIATSVCQELDGMNLLAAEFFCKRDSSERRDPQQALLTIVYGLALRHSEYAKAVADAIQRDPRVCSSPIQIQYDNLVKGPLETLSQAPPPANLVVIIDALDECGTTESRRQLLAYLYLMSQSASWLKIVVTSRPDSDIQLFFDDRATSRVTRKNVYDYNASIDINSFIHHRMVSSHKSKDLPPDATNLLTQHANGLFIWAKTACEFILNSHKPKSRFDLVIGGSGLSQTSSPLDDLYTTAIKTSLGDGGADEAQCVQEYLGAIIVCSTRTPLSVASLSDLLGEQVETSVLQSVVASLGSVLYIDYAQGAVVRVYHHSFTDYMTNSAPQNFRIDLELRNTELARCCLRTMIEELKFNICGLETSHVPNSEVSDLNTRINAMISLHLGYSCQYWTSHLTQCRSGELEELLRGFLLQPTVLYWIEVLSLLGKLAVAMFSALELSNWYQGSEEVYQCARDTYRFILAFYDPISKSTPHLYVSALSFCPSNTAFIRRLRARFQNTFNITRGAKEDWSPWLRCISHPTCVISIALSQDGRHIASGSDDKTVRIWDTNTGAALGDPLIGHSSSVWSVAFSPDGRRIVSGSSDNTMRLWDTDTGTALGNPLVGHSGTVWSVGFSPDGRQIVSGSNDQTIRVWSADTGAALGDPLVGHLAPVISVAFSPNSRRIVSASDDRTVRVWDVDRGTQLGEPLTGHSDHVWSASFSPDGQYIASGSKDETIRIWDVNTGAEIGTPMAGHTHGVHSVVFSPNGQRIISGSWDRTVRIWDIATGKMLGSPLVGHSDYVWSVALSPDGRHIISGSGDKTVRVWDVETGAALGDPLLGHSSYVLSVGFSPDGRRIVSGSSDSTVRVWDAETGAALGDPLLGHSDPVYSVGFSPDGRRIVSGSYDQTVRVWDAETGAALGDPLPGHSGPVASVGFSPDGRRIVSGSSDSTVRVWDAETGAALGDPLLGHSDPVYSVGFSPDGRRIVSGSDDKTVRVWDAETGAALGDPLLGHSSYVVSVGFSPDRRRIVSGSTDGTVRVWDAVSNPALSKPLERNSAPNRTHPVHDSVPACLISLPCNTSRMFDSLSSDGWVRDMNTDALLIWLPQEYQRSCIDDSLFVISKEAVPRPAILDYSKFVHGSKWEMIYTQ